MTTKIEDVSEMSLQADEIARAVAQMEERARNFEEFRRAVIGYRDRLDRLLATLGAGARPAGKAGRGPGRAAAGGRRVKAVCAVVGCGRPAKSLGYCLNHYQKLRNLEKTKRAEQFGWRRNAPPDSVEDVVLPRGRAAAKANKKR